MSTALSLLTECPECGAPVTTFTFQGHERTRIQHRNKCTAALDWLVHGDTYHLLGGDK